MCPFTQCHNDPKLGAGTYCQPVIASLDCQVNLWMNHDIGAYLLSHFRRNTSTTVCVGGWVSVHACVRVCVC